MASLLVILLEHLENVSALDVFLPVLLWGIRACEPDAKCLLIERFQSGAACIDAIAVVVALEVADVFQQQVAAENIVECNDIARVRIEQLHHQEVGVVGNGDGVAVVYHLHLLTVDLLSMLAYVHGPFVVDERLVENAQVFLGSERIAADIVALCQATYHADIPVVVREDICHHGSSLCKGHIAQDPIELVHIADGEHGRLRADPIECAQDVLRELHQMVGQFSSLRLHKVVEEEHLIRPFGGVLHFLDDFVVIAEVILAVDGKIFLQYQIGFLDVPDLWRAEKQPGRKQATAENDSPKLPAFHHGNYPEQQNPS